MRRAALVPARPTHIGPIASHMREADRRECEALGASPKQALRQSLRRSVEALTALDPDDGRPLAMMGVTTIGLVSGRGSVWFLGREEVYDYGRDLVARGPKIIAAWLELFESLENIVSADNVKAIRLLRRWGATFGSDPSERQVHHGVEFVSFRFDRLVSSLNEGV